MTSYGIGSWADPFTIEWAIPVTKKAARQFLASVLLKIATLVGHSDGRAEGATLIA